jgi:hypothetical protein
VEELTALIGLDPTTRTRDRNVAILCVHQAPDPKHSGPELYVSTVPLMKRLTPSPQKFVFSSILTYRPPEKERFVAERDHSFSSTTK